MGKFYWTRVYKGTRHCCQIYRDNPNKDLTIGVWNESLTLTHRSPPSSPLKLVILAIFVLGVFSSQEKSLLLLRFLWYLRTFWTPSWLLCFLSLEFCDFCDICHGCFQLARKSLVTFAIWYLRYLRTFRGPSWLLCFLSLEFCYICYFCGFCDICHGCF